MSIRDFIHRLSSPREKRSTVTPGSPISGADPGWWGSVFGGGNETAAGVKVNADTAMGLSAWYGAKVRIGFDVGQMPIDMYERGVNGNRERVRTHPVAFLVGDSPNKEQTAIEWKQFTVSQMMDSGNALDIQEVNNGQRVTQLIPVDWDNVTVERNKQTGELQYKVNRPSGQKIYPMEKVVHFKYLSTNGVTGLSPIRAAMETIGLGLAGQNHVARVFGNGAFPGMQVKLPGTMSEPDKKALKKDFTKLYGGDKAHSTIILDNDWDLSEIKRMSMKDAQLVELMNLTVQDIARIFAIPPHLLGDMSRATFSNIEEMGLSYLSQTLQPWLVNIEQRLMRSLFTVEERERFFLEFNPNVLLKTNLNDRFDAYTKSVGFGIMNVNEVRRKENMNDIGEQGEIHIVSLANTNLKTLTPEAIEADAAAKQALAEAEPEPTPDPEDDPEPAEDENNSRCDCAMCDATYYEREVCSDCQHIPGSGSCIGCEIEDEHVRELAARPHKRLATHSKKERVVKHYESTVKESLAVRAALPLRYKLRRTQGAAIRNAASRIAKRIAKDISERAAKDLGNNAPELFKEFLQEYFSVGGRTQEFMDEVYGPVFNALGKTVGAAAFAEVEDRSVRAEPNDQQLDSIINAFTSTFVAKVGRSKLKQMLELMDTTQDLAELERIINERLAEWEERDPEKVEDRQSSQLDGFIAVAVWKLSGVTKKVWRTVGENCPFCDELDGVVIGIDRQFVLEGGSVNADGNTMKSSGGTGHNPLHDGCDCFIEAA